LLIQKATDDMTNGLRLDQDSIGAVEQAALLEFEGEHVQEATPDVVARVGVDVHRQLAVDTSGGVIRVSRRRSTAS
jgi:hypothetical protein